MVVIQIFQLFLPGKIEYNVAAVIPAILALYGVQWVS
jgi:hypothetical protein